MYWNYRLSNFYIILYYNRKLFFGGLNAFKINENSGNCDFVKNSFIERLNHCSDRSEIMKISVLIKIINTLFHKIVK